MCVAVQQLTCGCMQASYHSALIAMPFGVVLLELLTGREPSGSAGGEGLVQQMLPLLSSLDSVQVGADAEMQLSIAVSNDLTEQLLAHA